jgi:fatty acid desaturase
MNDKKLYDDHWKELRQVINDSGIIEQAPIYGKINIMFSIILYVTWILLIWNIPIFLSVIYFYLLFVQFGYISHDLTHQQYFKKQKTNTFFSYIIGSLLFGMWYYWWLDKHNIKHHTYTNSDIHDNDIREADHIFIDEKWKHPFFEKYKAVLYWLFVPCMYVYLLYLSFSFSLNHKKYLDIGISILSLVLLWTPFILYFWLFQAGIAIMIMYVLVWTHLALAFMINHIGMEVIDGKRFKEYSWFDIQVRTSRNISGWYFIHFLFGGLNKQVEHHLFPRVSRNQMHKTAKIVKDFCHKRDIYYHEVTFLQALKEIQHTLVTGKTR